MSWIDDIRCLLCDGKLPLYRRITDGQFCSTAHRKAYWREHERLAVERLHQTHDSLRAYRPPPGGIEAILGQAEHRGQPEIYAEPDFPRLSGFILVQLALRFNLWPQATAAADPAACEIHPAPICPSDGFTCKEHECASAGPAEMAVRDQIGSFEPVHPVRRDVFLNTSSCTTEPAAATLLAATPLPAGPLAAGLHAAGLLRVPNPAEGRSGPVPQAPVALLRDATPLEGAVPLVRSLPLGIPPQSDELQRLLEDFQAREEEEQVPAPQKLCAIPAPLLRDSADTRRENIEALPAAPLPLAWMQLELRLLSPGTRFNADHKLYAIPAPLLRDSAGTRRENIEALPAAPLPPARMQLGLRLLPAGTRFNAELAPGALLPIPLSQAVSAAQLHGTPSGDPSALDDLRRGSEQPLQFALPMPALRPRLRLARGTRYAVQTPASAAPVAEPAPAVFPPGTPDIALPQRKAIAAASGSGKAARAPLPSNPPVPDQAGLVPLTLAEISLKPAGSPVTSVLSHGLIPQPPRTQLAHPVSKLEPLDGKPISDLVPPAAARPDAQLDPVYKAHIWTHATDFLRNAPRDLKTLVFAIPVLLGLALHPSLPKVRVSAPASASGMQRNIEHALNVELVNVRQTMADRAGVALDEDFRSGLDDWVSRGDATAEWSFDATGFVRPGPLALYRPSLGLTDYQLQFLGMIDQKAMSWVVRAADYENYYVIKLTVLKPGPLPTIGITRYAVVNGRADSRVDTIAPIDGRPDMLYRVRLDVHGSDYVLAIQGQIADVWSEPRLQHGGVGFFSARGEASRVRWVQVTHQYDMLGRLCAYLAPYNILSTNGSW